MKTVINFMMIGDGQAGGLLHTMTAEAIINSKEKYSDIIEKEKSCYLLLRATPLTLKTPLIVPHCPSGKLCGNGQMRVDNQPDYLIYLF